VPFFTTKPGGSGIGLVLSRQIAEAHGGSLTLENRKPGRGCVADCVATGQAVMSRPAARVGGNPGQVRSVSVPSERSAPRHGAALNDLGFPPCAAKLQPNGARLRWLLNQLLFFPKIRVLDTLPKCIIVLIHLTNSRERSTDRLSTP